MFLSAISISFLILFRHCSYVAPKKTGNFASWETWDEDLRREILELTKSSFCKFGYDRLLLATLGTIATMAGFCDSVSSAV